MDSLGKQVVENTAFFLLFLFLFVLLSFCRLNFLFFLFIFRLIFFYDTVFDVCEVIDLPFTLSVVVVDPFNSDWPGRFDGVLALSVIVLEEVDIGRQSKELSPTSNGLSHLLEVAEVVECNCALGRYTI